MKPQPRIVRPWHAHLPSSPPPDRLWDDVVAVALAIVFLLVIFALASVIPGTPR
jgi:hypothetical protein